MPANLYLDHNVSAEVVPLLVALGFDVMTAKDVGLEAVKDDEHLLFAARQQRVLITYNVKDFHLLHDAWLRWSLAWQVQQPHSGILILPQPPLWLVDRLAAELNAFVQSNPALSNELYHHRTAAGWTRRPLPLRLNS